jgi:hypothetical protein
VRWDALFADLEGQAEALSAAERAAEADERGRIELSSLHWLRRLDAAVGAEVQMRLAGAVSVRGRVERVGPDWMLLIEDAAREVLVPVAAVQVVGGLSRFAAAEETSVVASRLTLRSVLRALARDRSVVRIHLTAGGGVLDGTIDRVGADFVDLAEHPAGEPRRRGDVRSVALVPLDGLAAVRRQR